MSEVIRRVHGFDLYDVQIAAGLLLADGRVVEMQTGEGKTLRAALPALLYGLARAGVHVVTPNAYLAQRDFELLAPVYRLLGCTTGLLREGTRQEAAAYACDITYGTGYEFGFDFLRQQLLRQQRDATLGSQYLQLLNGSADISNVPVPRRFLAIIDEID